MDAGDALDLDAAVTSVAAQIGEVSDLPLDVRRSMAAGEVGRAQLALDLTDGSSGRGVDVSILMTDAQVADRQPARTSCSTRSPGGAAPPPPSLFGRC